MRFISSEFKQEKDQAYLEFCWKNYFNFSAIVFSTVWLEDGSKSARTTSFGFYLFH